MADGWNPDADTITGHQHRGPHQHRHAVVAVNERLHSGTESRWAYGWRTSPRCHAPCDATRVIDHTAPCSPESDPLDGELDPTTPGSGALGAGLPDRGVSAQAVMRATPTLQFYKNRG